MLTSKKLLKDLLRDLHKFNGDFSRAVVSHDAQKLRELIVVFEVLKEFVLLLWGEGDSDHHDEVFPCHVGLEVEESFRKPFSYLLSILLEVNSNRFHVILDLFLEDSLVLDHEVVLEADFIGLGEILSAFLVKGKFQPQIILICKSNRDVSFFGVSTLVFTVLKGVVGDELHVTEVESAFHVCSCALSNYYKIN